MMGGKTFIVSKFDYQNDNVNYISIEKLPYYEKNTLKIECSVYQINTTNDGYENKVSVFTSNDYGLNWILEK